MKKIFLSIAAIAATISIVSCDKDEQQPFPEGDVDDVTILAFTENVTATKTALIDDDYGYQVVWSKNDAFSLGGQIFSYIGEPGETSGEFEGQLPDEGTYTAFFPASYDGVNWPVHQIYHENGEITFSPMTAEVTVDDDDEAPESIRFRNAGGFLRIYATSKSEVPVKSITVIAPGLDAITLDCSEGVEISNDSTDFFIAMPAGAYKRASILLTDTSDRTCTKIVDIVIKRSGLTAVLNTIRPSTMKKGIC